VSIRRAAVRRQCERAGRTTAADDDEENIMHVQYLLLAAMEDDRRRATSRRQRIEEARRAHAARLTREQGFGTGRLRRTGRALTRAFGRRTAGAAA
jgi:hypothetical protein